MEEVDGWNSDPPCDHCSPTCWVLLPTPRPRPLPRLPAMPFLYLTNKQTCLCHQKTHLACQEPWAPTHSPHLPIPNTLLHLGDTVPPTHLGWDRMGWRKGQGDTCLVAVAGLALCLCILVCPNSHSTTFLLPATCPLCHLLHCFCPFEQTYIALPCPLTPIWENLFLCVPSAL